MSDCIFCKILKGEIPSSKVYEDKNVFGFVDIAPHSKEHYLFIHRNHTKDVNDLVQNSPQDLIDIYAAIKSFTEGCELAEKGFRVVTNSGRDGGQTVFHTHFHLLGGEPLRGFGS